MFEKKLFRTAGAAWVVAACLGGPAVVMADVIPPVATLVEPASDGVVTGMVNIRSAATDDSGSVKTVTLHVNGEPFYNMGRCWWEGVTHCVSLNSLWLANGTHTLTVTATDYANNVSSPSASVTLWTNNPPDTTPPVVYDYPLLNVAQPLSGQVTPVVSGADNVGIQRVEFHLDGALRYVSPTAGYPAASGGFGWYFWDTTTVSNGPHTLTAIIYDPWGNTAQKTETYEVYNAQNVPLAFGDVYVAPNPVTGGQATFTATVAPSAERVRLQVIDGRKNLVLDTDMTSFVLNANGQKVYTHPWTVTGSGRRYQFIVTAVSSAGESVKIYRKFIVSN